MDNGRTTDDGQTAGWKTGQHNTSILYMYCQWRYKSTIHCLDKTLRDTGQKFANKKFWYSNICLQ